MATDAVGQGHRCRIRRQVEAMTPAVELACHPAVIGHYSPTHSQGQAPVTYIHHIQVKLIRCSQPSSGAEILTQSKRISTYVVF